MTNVHKLLHMYFTRLPAFCCFAGVFVLITLAFDSKPVFMPLLYIVPFTVFFLIKEAAVEAALSKGIYVVLHLTAFLASLGFCVVMFEGAAMVISLISVGLIFIYSTRSISNEFPGYLYFASLIINTFQAIVFTYVDFYSPADDYSRAAAFLPVVLILLGLATSSRLICRLYMGFGFLVNNRAFRTQPRETMRKFFKRSIRLGYAFIALCVFCMVFFAIQEYNIALDIPLNWERRSSPEPIEVRGMFREWWEEDEPEGEVFEEEVLFEQETYWLSNEAVERFFLIVAVIAGLLVALAIIMGLLNYKHQKKEDELLDYDSGFEESAYVNERKRRGQREMPLSANQIVRRLFKRKVNEHRRRGLSLKPSHTAKVISDEIKPAEDITTLSGLYHTARYSGRKVSAADIAGLRKKK